MFTRQIQLSVEILVSVTLEIVDLCSTPFIPIDGNSIERLESGKTSDDQLFRCFTRPRIDIAQLTRRIERISKDTERSQRR